jgi:hypothetical protein
MAVGEIQAQADGAGAQWAECGGDRMSTQRKGLALLVVQLLLVLSIGAKYEWERHHCPMVWARAERLDPELPIRGRYSVVMLHASACGLPGQVTYGPLPPPRVSQGGRVQEWQNGKVLMWRVVPAVRDGQLSPKVVDESKPGPTQTLSLPQGDRCEYAWLNGSSDFFIPEHARSPFPLKDGQELWALVTVPPSGPVRPVKLAVSDASGFHVLSLD